MKMKDEMECDFHFFFFLLRDGGWIKNVQIFACNFKKRENVMWTTWGVYAIVIG